MDLTLTPEQEMIRRTARELARREIAPGAAARDRAHEYPRALVGRLAEMGFLGMAVPPEYGGGGLDVLSYVLAMEEVSAADASLGVIMSVNNSLVCDPLLKFGSERQKQEVLAPLARGEKLGCFALSEPEAGSDAANQRTAARAVEGGWLLNGQKNFITNAPVADYILLFAQADPAKQHKGIAAFVLPLPYPGVTVQKAEDKLGITASPCSSVSFDDARVGPEDLLGGPGEGFKIAMATLDGGRIGIAAQALGIGRAAFEAAARYSTERKAFGKPICELQAIQWKLADMAVALDAARLLTWRAAWMKDQGLRHAPESAMAKLMASEAATRIAHQAIQVHGGYGYLRDFPVERHYRDARITEIYEGTSEIQRLVIAASLLKD
ncbi:MAG TPA: acyl-CoA dehydrogenase [Myxococcota bacterium]|jgi:butyryl-CoA dehydrogenase|nr:acyl-CoA dehydrogenase [Myxococcota bacterium]